jgi:hypothetical protein
MPVYTKISDDILKYSQIFSNIFYIRACEVGGKSDFRLVKLWHPSLNTYHLYINI